jgi:HK97 family phage prohead protease
MPRERFVENQTEYRVVSDGELRATTERDARTIRGYAAVFDSPSLPINEHRHQFTERVRRGAFERTIREDDIRALFSHDESKILGRTKAGTLTLAEDQTGLRTTIRLPNTALAEDVYENVKVGNLTGFSFRFQARKDSWTNGGEQRELLDVRLDEISLVAFPCYTSTSAEARSIGFFSDSEVLVYAGITSAPVSGEEKRRLELRLSLLRRL